MKLKPLVLCLLCSLSLTSTSFAMAATNNVSTVANKSIGVTETQPESKNFQQFVLQLKQEALAKGYSQAIVNEAFTNIKEIPQVIAAKQGQLERKTTTAEYLADVLPANKIALAQQKYTTYLKQITPIAEHYHVSASYIVALWGLESDFGALQGHDDVIESLTSLIYHNQRTHLFKAELFACLDILQKGYATRADLKGFWAGAMGQVQFIPSSLLMYGQDWDKTGKIDIWHNLDDVFASIANFLSKKGWNNNMSWGQPVSFSKTISASLIGTATAQAKTIAQWLALGVVPSKPISKSHLQEKAWLIYPTGTTKQGYLVSNNFKVLLSWNDSDDFVLSVVKLAQDLK